MYSHGYPILGRRQSFGNGEKVRGHHRWVRFVVIKVVMFEEDLRLLSQISAVSGKVGMVKATPSGMTRGEFSPPCLVHLPTHVVDGVDAH